MLIPCRGGPLDGTPQAPLTFAKIYWLIDGRLIANTNDLDWTEIAKAEGAYVRHGRTQGRVTTDMLVFFPMPRRPQS